MNIASKLKFADVGLTGTPLFINTDFNNKLLTLHPLKKPVPPEEAIANKYLMDIDGISCSFSRMAWILYSNSMLMKHQSEKIQWYYDQLQPFVHYVPIAADFSDLQEKFNWAQTHQQEAQQIAHNGRELAQKVFAPEHILKAFESALLAYQEEMEAMLAKRD